MVETIDLYTGNITSLIMFLILLLALAFGVYKLIGVLEESFYDNELKELFVYLSLVFSVLLMVCSLVLLLKEASYIRNAQDLRILDNTEVVQSYTTAEKYPDYIIVLQNKEGRKFRAKVPESYFIEFTPGTYIEKGETLKLKQGFY